MVCFGHFECFEPSIFKKPTHFYLFDCCEGFNDVELEEQIKPVCCFWFEKLLFPTIFFRVFRKRRRNKNLKPKQVTRIILMVCLKIILVEICVSFFGKKGAESIDPKKSLKCPDCHKECKFVLRCWKNQIRLVH